MEREKRAKTTVKSLLGDLREKNVINEELKERLEFYSGKMKVSTLKFMYMLFSHSLLHTLVVI